MNGLLILDKPGGCTSRDVVNRVQKWFPRKTKIGHTGTLDPLATGVLVVCVGTATRLAEYVQAMGKTYAARFRLGAASSTDDADGEVVEQPGAEAVPCERIAAALASFQGTILQIPPAYSALKIDGKRSHNLARQGKEAPLAARPVRIDAIRMLHYDWPFVDVEIDCGKGTYIRSVARDLGEKLGVGGMVQTLRRTRVGPFSSDQGISWEATAAEAVERLLPPSAALTALPIVRIDAEQERRFRSGQALGRAAESAEPSAEGNGSEAAVFNERGNLVGIGIVAPRTIQPKIVLAA
ncbi:MAG TPA: tRNA pseudouridine(55) synthase TruB [Urbifossiella sp.]|nr:tRNA pseudouridine(55) synthase TruB [Urbifossiella sp.]